MAGIIIKKIRSAGAGVAMAAGMVLAPIAQAGYLQEQASCLTNFKVDQGEVSSFEMFISLIKVTLAGVGMVLLLVMVYSGLRWLFTATDQKMTFESGKVFWGAMAGFVGVVFAYAMLDFIFRVLL